MIASGTINNFVSAATAQAVKPKTINSELMCVTIGNKSKVPSTKLAKLSILFAFGATQIVLFCAVLKLGTPVILGMN